MDTPEKPKRPWWKKKRTRATAALWLLLAYPLSYGPTWRLWHGSNDREVRLALDLMFWPLDAVVDAGPSPLAYALVWYISLWEADAASQLTSAQPPISN